MSESDLGTDPLGRAILSAEGNLSADTLEAKRQRDARSLVAAVAAYPRDFAVPVLGAIVEAGARAAFGGQLGDVAGQATRKGLEWLAKHARAELEKL